jgi:hypothetical protein
MAKEKSDKQIQGEVDLHRYAITRALRSAKLVGISLEQIKLMTDDDLLKRPRIGIKSFHILRTIASEM